MKCCGLYSPKDWQVHGGFNLTETVPISCCKELKRCHRIVVASFIYTGGCLKRKIKRKFRYFQFFAISFIIGSGLNLAAVFFSRKALKPKEENENDGEGQEGIAMEALDEGIYDID